MVVTVAVEAVAAGAEVSGLLSKLPMHTSCLECLHIFAGRSHGANGSNAMPLGGKGRW